MMLRSIHGIAPFDVELPDKLLSALPKRQIDYLSGRSCAIHALGELGLKHLKKFPAKKALEPHIGLKAIVARLLTL